jgi:hypothetical protein
MSAALLSVLELSTKAVRMPILDPLHCFFDESGDINTDFVSVGGVALTSPQVVSLTAAWENVLTSAGITHTSMKDAIWFEGPYQGWDREKDKPKRDELLRALATIIAVPDVPCIAATGDVSRHSFNR